jgi:hypothetical protein
MQFSCCWHWLRLLGCVREPCYQSNKAVKRYNPVENCLEQGSKPKKQAVTAERQVGIALWGLLWRRTAHHGLLPGTALPAHVALALCSISWSDLGLPPDGPHMQAAIFLAVTFLCIGKLWFFLVSAAPELARLRHVGGIEGKGQHYGSPKYSQGRKNWDL